MIPAIVIGRAGSQGFPNKNLHHILGRALCEYPLLAAKHARGVDHVFVSTDSPEIAAVGRSIGASIIERPDKLANNTAQSHDAFAHAYRWIAERHQVEMVVLLFCNGATITPGIIDRGIDALRSDAELDSAVTVSRYNMWSPLRAHRIERGRLRPFFDHAAFPNATCDRDSQGDTFFPDCSAFVVRPRCFEPGQGVPPFPWIGHNVLPLEQWGGLDIDYEWQVPQVEHWLGQHGFTRTATPYDAE